MLHVCNQVGRFLSSTAKHARNKNETAWSSSISSTSSITAAKEQQKQRLQQHLEAAPHGVRPCDDGACIRGSGVTRHSFDHRGISPEARTGHKHTHTHTHDRLFLTFADGDDDDGGAPR